MYSSLCTRVLKTKRDISHWPETTFCNTPGSPTHCSSICSFLQHSRVTGCKRNSWYLIQFRDNQWWTDTFFLVDFVWYPLPLVPPPPTNCHTLHPFVVDPEQFEVWRSSDQQSQAVHEVGRLGWKGIESQGFALSAWLGNKAEPLFSAAVYTSVQKKTRKISTVFEDLSTISVFFRTEVKPYL